MVKVRHALRDCICLNEVRSQGFFLPCLARQRQARLVATAMPAMDHAARFRNKLWHLGWSNRIQNRKLTLGVLPNHTGRSRNKLST